MGRRIEILLAEQACMLYITKSPRCFSYGIESLCLQHGRFDISNTIWSRVGGVVCCCWLLECDATFVPARRPLLGSRGICSERETTRHIVGD